MFDELPVHVLQKERERALARAGQTCARLLRALDAEDGVPGTLWRRRPSASLLRQTILRSLAIAVLVVLLAWGLTTIARAQAPLLVTKCPGGDGDVVELATAIDLANSDAGQDTIIMPANCVYTLVEPRERSTGNGATIRRSSEITTTFRLITAIDASLWLRDLTLENGSAIFAGAAAVSRIRGPVQLLVVEDAIFRHNNGDLAAGAFMASNLEVIVKESLFEDNHTTGEPGIGGALVVSFGKLHITRSTFIDNSASRRGGAVAGDNSTVDLDNNTFDRNGANVGGAVYMTNNPEGSVWTNNVWSNNRALGFEEGFAVKAAAIYISQSGPLTVLHNTFVHSLATDAAAIVADNQPHNTETLVRNSIFVNFGNSISSRHPLTNPVNDPSLYSLTRQI